MSLLILVPVVGAASVFALYRFTPEMADVYSLPRFIFAVVLLNGWGLPDSVGWNIPSWSVSSEWFAYLCFPFIAVAFNRVVSPLAPVMVIVGVFTLTVSLSLLLMGGQTSMLGEQWTLLRVSSEFIVGCSLYNLYRRMPESRIYDWMALGAVVFIIGLASRGHLGWYGFLILVGFAVLILALSRAQGMVAAAFVVPGLIYLGRISYSLYLTHYTVLMVWNQVFRRLVGDGLGPWAYYWGFMLVYLPAIILAGHLMYSLGRGTRSTTAVAYLGGRQTRAYLSGLTELKCLFSSGDLA